MHRVGKLCVAVLLSAMIFGSYAQKIGVKAGMNLSNMVMKDDDFTQSEDFKMKIGFNAGASAEFPITEIFSVESGLMINTRGFTMEEKFTEMGETVEMKVSGNLLYLDIPVNAKVGYSMDNLKIYGSAGPYLGFGLSGNQKSETTFMGETQKTDEDVEFGSDDNSDIKRMDLGLNLGAGVEFGSFQIGGSYGLSLLNNSPVDDNGATITHNVIAISLGYVFYGIN
ncbi:MAG: porin family protein [Chitinispirillaceae bacterium]